MNRGVVLRSLNRPAEALAEYDRAIGLREDLRARLGVEWPPDWAKSLANTYENRSIAFKSLGRMDEAEKDLQRAEALRNQP
ncbi:tetratricopeptide repeat protein [Methylococcus capsulatus]|jgi:tetratricopeptide (TPR) repeat protein|uniref:tetratricopeptide repeat protein n=1 Tax=Methylococcus capsulatus TaxID=414 RepID=UPI001C52EC2C|nr:tetratricopeptide repeat protein [Methylococcus capsulatus]QXP89633.1 tetratricopeptide repeat protein [Methylococcus capsulatus]